MLLLYRITILCNSDLIKKLELLFSFPMKLHRITPMGIRFTLLQHPNLPFRVWFSNSITINLILFTLKSPGGERRSEASPYDAVKNDTMESILF